MEGSWDEYTWNHAHWWRVYPQYNFRQRIRYKLYIHWYRLRFAMWIDDRPGEYFRPWWYYTDLYNRYTWAHHYQKYYRYFRRIYHAERVIMHANYWSYWRNWWRIRRKMHSMFWSWFYNRYRDGFLWHYTHHDRYVDRLWTYSDTEIKNFDDWPKMKGKWFKIHIDKSYWWEHRPSRHMWSHLWNWTHSTIRLRYNWEYPIALGRHHHHYWLPDRKISVWDWWSWNYRVWGWWSWWYIYYHYYSHGMGSFMQQTAHYHYRASTLGHMPPPPYGAYHWWHTLNYRNPFHLQNHRFFRVHFGGKKGGFNGLIYGENLTYHYSHLQESFDHFYTYSASPMWTQHSQVVKNNFGNTGWAAYKGYQDVDLEDMNVSNRYSVNFNSIVYKLISSREKFDNFHADPWMVYGEVLMKPSNVLSNKNSWNYLNTYGMGRGKRRFNQWHKYPVVRVFPGKIQNHGFQYAISAVACMYLRNSSYTNRYAIELVSGYFRHYPAMHAYRAHAWRWASFDSPWHRHPGNKKKPGNTFTYRFSMYMANHWWPQHAKNVYFTFWDNHYNYTNGNIWAHYFRDLEPRIVVANTEEGLENAFVPIAFKPRVFTSGTIGFHRGHHICDHMSQSQNSMYKPGRDCNVWEPWWRDSLMRIYTRKDWYTKYKPRTNTMCLITHNDRLPWAYRSRIPHQGFKRECVGMDEIWSRKHKRCVPLVNCKAKHINQQACATCDNGFELIAKGKDGWKSRSWFDKMKKLGQYNAALGK